MAEQLKILNNLRWIGHDSFRIEKPIVIYIDPWKLSDDPPPADLILISHEHQDHCSPEDIERIRTSETKVVANPSASKKIKTPVTILPAGESIEYQNVLIKAVPAYNIEKPFHPKSAGHVGYILIIEGESLYFAGDTDHIQEMSDFSCDVALLPVSGTYVMEAEEACRAAADIGPRVAIPMHYGAGVVGTVEDAQKFKENCSVPVVILEVDAGA
jgi:L-ascorbate metabolism protein UlaG (beta-lactamase superfamily)